MRLKGRLKISFMRHYRFYLFIFALSLILFFGRALGEYIPELVEDTTIYAGRPTGNEISLPTSGVCGVLGCSINTMEATATEGILDSVEIYNICKYPSGASGTFRIEILNNALSLLAYSDTRVLSSLNTCTLLDNGDNYNPLIVGFDDFTILEGADLIFTESEKYFWAIKIISGSGLVMNTAIEDYTNNPNQYDINYENPRGLSTSLVFRHKTFFSTWENPLVLPTLSCSGACPIENNIAYVNYECTDGGSFYGYNGLIESSAYFLNEVCADNESGIIELPVVEGNNQWYFHLLNPAIGQSDVGLLVIPYSTDDESPLPPDVLTPDIIVLDEPFTIRVKCLQDNSILKYSIDTVYQNNLALCETNLLYETDEWIAQTGEHTYCFWVQNDGTVNIKNSESECITVTGKGLSDTCLLVNRIELAGDENIVITAINAILQRLVNTPLIGDVMMINCLLYHDFYGNLGNESLEDLSWHIEALGTETYLPIPLTDVHNEMEIWLGSGDDVQEFKAKLTALLWFILVFSLFLFALFKYKGITNTDNNNDIDDNSN